MKRREFSIDVNASPEKVWNVLWDMESFYLYTAPFCEDSQVKTTWQEGTEVKFLNAEGNGTMGIIRRNRAPQVMWIEILGLVWQGEVDTSSEQAEKWKGAIERYTLTSEKGKVVLHIEADIADEMLDHFEKAWPAALEVVKELVEEGMTASRKKGGKSIGI